MKQEIIEKIDELKQLVSKLDNQRADFLDEDEGLFMWNGEELDLCDLKIFSGSGWYNDDEVHVESVYVEDDKLYFDAFWNLYNSKGNCINNEDIDHLEPEFIVQRFWDESQENAFIETLEFLIELIKEII